jgi:hypothetical protein
MDVKRFRVGVTEGTRETITQGAAITGALLIVVSLFLPWYSIGLSDSAKSLAEVGIQGELESADELDVDAGELEAARDLIDTSVDYSGWSSLELADALLLFVAIAAALFALSRRRGSSATPRDGDDKLMWVGLASVVVVLVLLLTKNSTLGMLDSTIGFAQDKAADLGVPGAQLEVLSIGPGIGLWLGLLGSLAILAAGVFHSRVDPGGTSEQTTTVAETPGPPPPPTP